MTPNRSVLGAAIGREPGGCAPAVVDDLSLWPMERRAQQFPLEVPEPGRDMFAQQAVTEAKSLPKLVDRKRMKGSRELWAHIVLERLEIAAQNEREGQHKPEGPLDQAGTPANGAAQELYPEADTGWYTVIGLLIIQLGYDTLFQTISITHPATRTRAATVIFAHVKVGSFFRLPSPVWVKDGNKMK
ncbi:hypothetical protein J3A83DRAFT_4186286 [Scleroderma citrinum]